jgi:phosphatidate cytidylyltransferase
MTALVMVPILFWIILQGPSYTWVLLVTLAAGIGLYEFYDMTMGDADRAIGAVGIALGTLLVPLMVSGRLVLFLCGLSVAVLFMFLAVLFSYSKVERAAPLIGYGVSGLFYVAVTLGFLTLLRVEPSLDHGRYWVLLLLAVTWMGDTSAYFGGKAFGRHKLAPVVSPKKTWEGAVSGALGSVLAAFVVVNVTPLSIPPAYIIALALPAAVLGQLGDLCESIIKRSMGVKDSGTIVYGHGGILDRIDALLFAGPYFYFFYRFTAGWADVVR